MNSYKSIYFKEKNREMGPSCADVGKQVKKANEMFCDDILLVRLFLVLTGWWRDVYGFEVKGIVKLMPVIIFLKKLISLLFFFSVYNFFHDLYIIK